MAVGMSFPAHAAGQKSSVLDGVTITGKSEIVGKSAKGYTYRSTSGNLSVKITYQYIPEGKTSMTSATESRTSGGTSLSITSSKKADYMLSVNGEHTITVSNGTKAILYT